MANNKVFKEYLYNALPASDDLKFNPGDKVKVKSGSRFKSYILSSTRVWTFSQGISDDQDARLQQLQQPVIDKLNNDYTRAEIDAQKAATNSRIDNVVIGITASIGPADAAPSVDGIYRAKTSGTYANLGGLVAQLGFVTDFKRTAGVWTIFQEVKSTETTGRDILNPLGENIPKEKAVAYYVKPLTDKLVISKNLGDKSIIRASNFNALGTEINSVNWISIRLVISSLANITVSGLKEMAASGVRFVFFDAAGALVPGANVMGAGLGITTQTVARPATAVEIGINIANEVNIGVTPTNNVYANALQVESGTVATSYVAYSNAINADKLDYNVKQADLNISNKLNSVTVVARNFFNYQTDFQKGSWSENGTYISSDNWICTVKKDISALNPSNKIAIQGLGNNVGITTSLVAFFNASNVFISAIPGQGLTNPDKIVVDRPINAVYIAVTIMNEVGIGINPVNNRFISIFQAEDGESFSDPIPAGTYINPNALLGGGNSDYDTSKIIIRRNSANYINVYIHGGGKKDEWLKLDVIRTIDNVKFIDTWRFNQVWKTIRTGTIFSDTLQIVMNGSWENAIYTGGAGYPDALGSIHGCELLSNIFLFADGKKIDTTVAFEDIECSNFSMVQRSGLTTPNGLSDAAVSNKKWTISNRVLNIKNRIKWKSIISVTVNSYLSMIATNRSYLTNQVTHTATANEDYTEYDVSVEGFVTPIYSDQQNPQRSSIIIWGDEVKVEMNILQRKVTKANGTVYPFGFPNAGMYVQNTNVYNKCYGKFGSDITGNGDLWEVETEYKISL